MAQSGTPDDVEVRTLAVTGEIDIATAEALVSEAFDELDAGPGILELDLGAVTFLDSSGLSALVRIRSEATGRDIALRLTRVPPAVARVIEVSGLDDAFDVQAGD